MDETKETFLTLNDNREMGALGSVDDWESVEALQGKMGELGEEDGQARKELMEKLEYFESLSFDDATDEESKKIDAEVEELLRIVNAGGYWSDEEIVRRMAKIGECKVYKFCEVGMPVEMILENPEYYNDMVEDQQYDIPLFVINMFYEAMVGNPGGEKKFREDLVDGKDFTGSIFCSSDILEGRCDEGELSALKVLKRAGVSIAETVAKSEYYGFHYAKTYNKKTGLSSLNFCWITKFLMVKIYDKCMNPH